MKYFRLKIDAITCALTFSAALFVGAAPVYAQADAPSPNPVLPAGPLPAPAPAFSQWTITFTYPDDQKANATGATPDAAKALAGDQASRPRTVVTTKTGEIVHEETTTVGGAKMEDWQVNGNYYIKYPGNNYWSAYEKADGNQSISRFRAAMVLPASGFFGLDWIRQDAYAGTVQTSSGANLVFVPGGMDAANGGDLQQKLQSLPTVACLNAKTRLPVMARTPTETRQFAFSSSPPDSVQALPADLADEIKKGNEIRAKRAGAPQREY